VFRHAASSSVAAHRLAARIRLCAASSSVAAHRLAARIRLCTASSSVAAHRATLARRSSRAEVPVIRVPQFVRLVRHVVSAALVLLAAGGVPAEPAGEPRTPSLEALMAGMAETSGVWARFVERKEVALLSEPIETRGTLVFVPPDRLRRSTAEPSRSELVIAGERFAFRDAAGADAVDLSASPLARQFVENFIVLFNGDLAKLRERYEPEFTSAGADWSLALRPRNRPLSDLIERITLAGTGQVLRSMEMLEQDGDRTTTRFSDVEVDRHFTPAELEQLFVLPTADAPAP
jgi:outer membrane lipoprotein-sorting protein